MAKGIRDGIVWTLDSVELFTGQPPLKEQSEEFLVIKTPHQNKFVVRSAEELRQRLPKNGFENVGMRRSMWAGIPSSAG